MTVYCEHCESDECLELTGGDLEIVDGEIEYAKLEYRCTEHGLTGTYHGEGCVHRVLGALVLVESRGVPIDEQRAIPDGGEEQ